MKRRGMMSKKAVIAMRTNSIRKRGFAIPNEKFKTSNDAKNVDNWSNSKLLRKAAAEAGKWQRELRAM